VSRRRPWVGVSFVLVPLVAFTWLLASGLGKDPRALPSELTGRAAPTFVLRELDGARSVALAELRGQVVVLNFWASWCAECRLEHPSLMAAWDRYRDRGVVFLGVDFEDSAGAAAEFQAERGGDWPLLLDPGSRTALDYGVYGVPETFVIAPDGTIAAKRVGPVSYSWLTDRIESALRTGQAA
jgi:cytochrome c biogenesis protein CcmG/thiol:disulfide interchange protein DsbE